MGTSEAPQVASSAGRLVRVLGDKRILDREQPDYAR